MSYPKSGAFNWIDCPCCRRNTIFIDCDCTDAAKRAACEDDRIAQYQPVIETPTYHDTTDLSEFDF